MMNMPLHRRSLSVSLALLITFLPICAAAQKQVYPRVLGSAEVARIAPANFYFEGQSGPVQMRNTAAAQLAANRHVMAGLVDTSGYSADTREKAQGFIITSLPLSIAGEQLAVGTYGLGFVEGKMNVYDLSGTLVLSVATASDQALRRPRPLAMTASADGLRLYSGRSYAVIVAK